MADMVDNWSTNSNESVAISLVTPTDTGLKTIANFHPKFTLLIFDEESIFGYQGLKIHLKYHVCDMRPNLQITYNKKFKTQGETGATDINEALGHFLPKVAFEKSSIFNAAIKDDMFKNWKPPGELYETGSIGDTTFEIWKGSLANKAIQQFLKRVQILVPFFIEAGSVLDLDLERPDRWTVFLMYKKTEDESQSSPYTFMGYSTIYRFPYLASTSKLFPVKNSLAGRPATLDFQYPLSPSLLFHEEMEGIGLSTSYFPCRSRIAQFLILPPFQKGGNGSRFYEAIFGFYLNDSRTVEITVEDPNESFDDLRDLNDLRRLQSIPEFASLRINNTVSVGKKGRFPTNKIVDLTAIETLREKTKIAPRQFLRLVEMQLLSLIPTSIRKSLILEPKKGDSVDLKAKEHEYYLWRLLVKQRLYRHNKDTLIQLDRAERIDRLEDTLDTVEADYARLLRALDQRSCKFTSGIDDSGKRPATQGLHEGEPLTKRIKFTDA